MQFAALLRRHFHRAFEIKLLISAKEGVAQASTALLELHRWPVLIVNADLRLIQMNRAAEELVGRRESFSVRSGKLRVRDTTEDARLLARIKGALSNHSLSSVPPTSAFRTRRAALVEPYVVEVVRLRGPEAELVEPRAAIIVVDPESRPSAPRFLQTVYGLTPAAFKLSAALASGASLREHSKSSGIGYETARTHLKSIARKLGVRRQSDVIAKISQLAALERS